jgi:DNA-binding IclR family transcriptional regulator
VLLAYADRALQERILAGPLSTISPETITDAGDLRRKLAEVRALGYANAPGYIEAVSTGVAVPVHDETGNVTAALSVVLRRDNSTEPALRELLAAARDIERALGARR